MNRYYTLLTANRNSIGLHYMTVYKGLYQKLKICCSDPQFLTAFEYKDVTDLIENSDSCIF